MTTVKNDFTFFHRRRVALEFFVHTLASKAHKIFRTVIRFISINVMNFFMSLKIASDHFLNNKTMLENVIVHNSLRVIMRINQNVAVFRDQFSSLPKSALFSRSSFIALDDGFYYGLGFFPSAQGIAYFLSVLFRKWRRDSNLGGCAHFSPRFRGMLRSFFHFMPPRFV